MYSKAMTASMINHCLVAANLCVDDGNDLVANDRMKATFREVAREVSHWQLGGIKKAALFLRPMEKALVQAHGPLLGRELYWDFVDSFWIQSWTDIPLEETRLERPVAQTKEWHWKVMAQRTLRHLICYEDEYPGQLHRD